MDRVCYECGLLGHICKWCARLRQTGKVAQQQLNSQAIVSAGRRGSLFSRDHPQLGWGGHTTSRGGGQLGRGSTHPNRGDSKIGYMTHFYAFPCRHEAEASHTMIRGTTIICDQMVTSLFDPT